MPKKRPKAKARAGAKAFPGERVQIDFVILADAAQVSNQKLYMLGGAWNLLRPEAYPTNFPFAVAIGILVPWSETNREHSFEFTIKASEGAHLGKGGGKFEVGREVGLKPGMTQRFTFAISGQIGLEAPGTFEIVVTISGEEKRVTFEAMPPSKAK